MALVLGTPGKRNFCTIYGALTPPGGTIELVAVGAFTHILDLTSVSGILS